MNMKYHDPDAAPHGSRLPLLEALHVGPLIHRQVLAVHGGRGR